MSEIEQKKGEEGVELAEQYLESTLKFDIFLKAYDSPAPVGHIGIDNNFHEYDIYCGFIKRFKPRITIPVFVEVKSRTSSDDLGKMYNDFVLRSFSVFLKCRKIKKTYAPYFLFFVDHPFYCSNFTEIRLIDHVNQLIEKFPGKYGIIKNFSLNIIKRFCDNLWIIIFCREPQELFFLDDREDTIKSLRKF
ncbi:MAG: hypothetical protein ACFFG0_48690 [Candidatus Thorarchaeota archaeon]